MIWFALLLLQNAGAACTAPTGVSGEVQYIPATKDLEFCNGSIWVSMLVAPTASACAVAGTLVNQGSPPDLQYCDGSVWNSVASPVTNGSCALPGQFQFNTAANWVEWCDGTNWRVAYPQPSVNLDFTTGALPLTVRVQRPTALGTGPGSFTDSTGVVRSAAANLFPYSQKTQSAFGTVSGGTLADNVALAPDGTATAATFIESTATAAHYVEANLGGVTPNATYTFSAFIKPAGRTSVRLTVYDGLYVNNIASTIDFGTLTTTPSAAGITSTIVPAGGGWFRVTVSGTVATGSILSNVIARIALVNGSTTYAGNGTAGVTIWGVQLETGVNASAPIFTNGVASYGARMDFDPVSGLPRGLLIEETRQNLVFPSNRTSMTAQASVVVSTSLAPDGSSAYKLTEDSTNNTHYAVFNVTGASNQIYSYSIFVKASGRTKVLIAGGKTGSPATRGGLMVDLTNGTFVNFDNGAPTTVAGRTVTPAGNGWYRATLSVLPDAVSMDLTLEARLTQNGTTTYAGDGASGVLIWGAQIERGSFPTSVIPTTTAAVTRPADVLTLPSAATNLSSLGGTVFVGTTIPSSASSVGTAFELSDGSNLNRITATVSNVQQQVQVTALGSTVFTATSPALTATLNAAVTYRASDFAASLSGSTVTTQVSGQVPAVSVLGLGSSVASGGSFLNGWLIGMKYYTARLSNLQVLHLGTAGLP